MKNVLLTGDCIEKINEIQDGTIQACITSPPYAMQRKIYNGIDEKNYPSWTKDWMSALEPKLTPNASILINIRAHLKNGKVSPYVLKTRLLLQESGWIECEELIWFKPDAPPLGSINRPRRTWESILWYSKVSDPFVNLFACGNESERIGGFAGSARFDTDKNNPIHKGQNHTFKNGKSRVSDVFVARIAEIEKGVLHPAMFPNTLAEKLILTFSSPGDLILDCFSGSGTTCCSAKRLGRDYIGIDMSEEYNKIAADRIEKSGLKGKEEAVENAQMKAYFTE